MQIESYLNGILPRSEKALQIGSAWLKGRETEENFNKILEKETREYIELQRNLGFDYIVDGQLFWRDLLRPMASALNLHRENSSADENPVTRQAYTNTFYRKPFFSKRIVENSVKIIDNKLINLINERKRKVILPSPFALAYLSDGIHWNINGTINIQVFNELLMDVAKILNREIKRLRQESKISFAQFNEPCIAYAKETKLIWENIVESLNLATKDLRIITSLHLYNGDMSKFLPDLFELPVDRIGLDVYTTNLKKFENSKCEKFLEIGIINSKGSLVEDPNIIAKHAELVIEKINPKGLALVPNRPLELVPQQIAIKKIETLAKAAKILKSK